MFATVERIRDDLAEVVEALDTDGLDGSGAARLLERFAAIERLGANAKTLVARRLAETRGWRREGDRTMAHFVARKTGTSMADATATVKTAQQLDPWGATADAMKAGEVSAQQATEITDAVAADPHAERELLDTASTDGFGALRNECRRVKASARTDELAHDEAIRRARYVRAWTDAEGAGRGEWKLPPEAQARLLARLDAETEGLVREAKQAGAPIESRDARMADALVRVADSGPGGHHSKVAIHLRVDHAAFERGHTEPGEVCEIEGVGPVPVATARNLSTDALIYVLATKGTEITHYAEHGRYIPKALRLTLEARDSVCVALGCNVRDNLEIHHRDPVDNNGKTSAKNCCRLCHWHHYLCTHQGWEVGGSADTGWSFDPPSGRSPPDALKLAVSRISCLAGYFPSDGVRPSTSISKYSLLAYGPTTPSTTSVTAATDSPSQMQMPSE